MTTAVCYHCGSIKHGAFCACGACGNAPRTEAELSLSLAMTDHFFDVAALNDFGAKIRRGEAVAIDPASQRQVVELLHESGVFHRLQRFHLDQAAQAEQPPAVFSPTPAPPAPVETPAAGPEVAPPPAPAAPEEPAPSPSSPRRPWWKLW